MSLSARAVWARARDAADMVATPLLPSHYLELVAPLATTHVRHARIEGVRTETLTTRTFTLRPGRGWRAHRPGQFVNVGVEVDGRILTRAYSISSTPDRDDGRFTITVTAIPGGRVSGALVRRAKVGDYVRIGLPQGEFLMSEAPPPRVLFVTGGSGVTPIMSMLRTFEARGSMPDVAHLHYARTASDVIFARELATLSLRHATYRLTVLTTRERSPAPRLDRTALDEAAPGWETREAWACGPETLLDAVSAHVPTGLHVERFRPKLLPNPNPSGPARVRFGLSKRDVTTDGATPLLAVAERAGIHAPHGCRIGICHSCDATLRSGCVRDLRTGTRVNEPGASFQPCVSAAEGDVEIDL